MAKTLVLTPPIESRIVTQPFGGDKKTYERFGLDGHNGIDYAAHHGQPIYAAHDGIATYDIDENSGHWVSILGTEECNMGKWGKGYARTVYLHLCDGEKEPKYRSPLFKKKRFPVKARDLIGYADDTGFSTGDHLHFGFKPSANDGAALFYQNGFKGAVDPYPFIESPEKVEKLKKQVVLLSTIVSLYKKLKGVK